MYPIRPKGGRDSTPISNDHGAHPIGDSLITPEPGGSARVRKTYSTIGEAFNLDHILRLVSEGGHATSQDKILEFSKEHKGGGQLLPSRCHASKGCC